MTTANGHAITDHGQLLVETVSPTRQGAIINWLCVHAGVLIMEDEDSLVEGHWMVNRGPTTRVVEVEIVVL